MTGRRVWSTARRPLQHAQQLAPRPAGHHPAADQNDQRADHVEPVVDRQVDRLVQDIQNLLLLLLHGPFPGVKPAGAR